MTGPTHRVYAVLFAYIATIIIYENNLSNIIYYSILILVLLLSKKGAAFPDLDHAWHNIGDKSVPNKIINSIIHLTGGKHRSWQTHSLDIFIAFVVIGYISINKFYQLNIISALNAEVFLIILLGFSSGWASHLFSDALTVQGIRLFCWNKRIIIRIVPKKLGKLKFNTGNEWERFNFKVISFTNKIVGTLCVLYPYIEKNIKEMLNLLWE